MHCAHAAQALNQIVDIKRNPTYVVMDLGCTRSMGSREVNLLVQGMTKLVEPLILVILGAIVGGILSAMYLPMFMAAGGVD